MKKFILSFLIMCHMSIAITTPGCPIVGGILLVFASAASYILPRTEKGKSCHCLCNICCCKDKKKEDSKKQTIVTQQPGASGEKKTEKKPLLSLS